MLILLVCLALRVGFFLAARPWDEQVQTETVLHADAAGYDELAKAMLAEGRFGSGRLSALRTPAYPLFIAGSYALFGPRPWTVLLLQILFDAASCGLLYAALVSVLSRKAALVAAVFYAADPFLILHCSMLLAETLFVFFCVAGLFFLSRALRAPPAAASVWPAAGAGLAFGLAALSRPVAVYLPVVIAAVLLIVLWRRRKVWLLNMAAFAAVFAATVIPWCIRNWLAYDTFSLSSSGQYNLLVLHAAVMEASRRSQPYETVKQAMLAEADEQMAGDGINPDRANEFQKATYWKRLAMQYIRRRPGTFAKYCGRGVVHSFCNLSTGEFSRVLDLPRAEQGSGTFDIKAYPNLIEAAGAWFSRKSACEIVVGFIVLVFLLLSVGCSAFGLATAWSGRTWGLLLPCLAVAAYFILIAGPAGLARFRLPAVPFYLPFAGAGAVWLAGRLRKDTQQRTDT